MNTKKTLSVVESVKVGNPDEAPVANLKKPKPMFTLGPEVDVKLPEPKTGVFVKANKPGRNQSHNTFGYLRQAKDGRRSIKIG
jgi:hypothetical protein